MKIKLKEIENKLNNLTIFRSLLNEDIIIKLNRLLSSDPQSREEFTAIYCDFAAALYKKNTNFSSYLYSYVMENENIYIEKKAAGEKTDKILEEALLNDLSIIEELSKITPLDISGGHLGESFLPKWKNTHYDFKNHYLEKIKKLSTEGYGIYSKYHMFTLRENVLLPVKYPDSQKIEDLIGYGRERELIIKNTKAFLKGLKASNVLLYGDAGTGKSSTVKAIANKYRKEGLRLIEVKKQQLYLLPELIDNLAKNPLKFIIFIDDLSFSGNDDNFVALKTILEGSVASYSKNIIIYATTNRRHFVKESMKDRNSDELFTNDSLQETMSLAARFGLTITFLKPDKDLYLEIVKALAAANNLKLTGEELIKKAEAFAIRKNGRSPRTAKQFVELEKIKENILK